MKVVYIFQMQYIYSCLEKSPTITQGILSSSVSTDDMWEWEFGLIWSRRIINRSLLAGPRLATQWWFFSKRNRQAWNGDGRVWTWRTLGVLSEVMAQVYSLHHDGTTYPFFSLDIYRSWISYYSFLSSIFGHVLIQNSSITLGGILLLLKEPSRTKAPHSVQQPSSTCRTDAIKV